VVQYTDTSEPGTSVITDWLWDFGDSETDTVQNPQHTYANPGKYDVTLTVTTKDGIDTLVETAFIVVTGTYPPTASFTATPTTGTVTTGTAPLQVTFTDTSKPGTSPITAWAWDFGDGTTATTQSPTHIYDRFGVYTVSLTVTTKDGVNTKTSANLVTATSNLLTYGGAAADWAKAVAVLPDGGFALAGATQSQGAGGQDMVLVRTDASATLQWTKTFGGGGDDAANAMAVSSDGGFVLAGSSVQEDGDQRIFVVKTDADGNRVWSRLLGPGNADAAQAVIETSDGGFLVAGSTADNAQDLPDAYLVKLDASGNPRWSQVWADAGSGVWNAVAETASGGYVLAGGLSGAMALVATDASGKESWRKTYTPGADAAAAALTPSLEGGWILAGSCLSYQGPSAICVVRTDDTGNALWTRTYGGPGDNRGYAVLETPMRDIVVAGATDSVGAGLFDMYLLQLDTTGKVLATNTYGGARSDRAYALAPLSDGFAIAGETESLGEGGADMALVITGADGTAITYPQISR
jgi:PKD repeat protein